MLPLRVEIALPLHRRGTLTYRVGPEIAGRAVPGARALVPLGKKRALGFIVSAGGAGLAGEGEDRLRGVIDVPDEAPMLTPEILQLTRWASDYYLCSWGEMIRAAVPGGLSLRTPRRVRVNQAGREELETILPGSEGPRENLLRALSAAAEEGVDREAIVRKIGKGAGPALTSLVTSGFAEVVEEPHRASPANIAAARSFRRRGGVGEPAADGSARTHPGEHPMIDASSPLTSAQENAVAGVARSLMEEQPRPILLHGVTGSGKTEVYLRAIALCLRRGRGALYLVPEIGLTPLLARMIRSRFGDQVAVLHSGLSIAERRYEWARLSAGEANVVLGPRSAVFAPVRRLGLVVVDEEQDPAYKQQDSPRYNARDLALVRARQAGAAAVLGTATPSLETWRNARVGKYALLDLPQRVAGRTLPRIEVVDLRQEFRETGESRVLSRRLVEALRERISRGEQSVVLINRRGYAPFMLCRSCGQTVKCKRCSVSLVLHGTDDTLRCHYCGARRRRPVLCPSCLSEHVHSVGEGTERAEKHLRRELPGARIERMDSDSVRGRRDYDRILAAFVRREIDVLVGTQMVAKGHDFPNVTLVGVLLADGMLGRPDFRAAERTYQLLTQASGRAGRGELRGEVVIQAVHPGHYAIASAASQDERGFLDKEMRMRRALRFPPFTVFAQVIARGSKLDKAAEAARMAADSLRRHGGGRVTVLGPAPAPIARLRGEHRVQVIARAASRRRLGAALAAMLDDAEEKGLSYALTVDVDPMTLL